ncbi:DMT family transporter [Hyphomicrobiales bacterium FT118]|uniref:DMT family transporter n=2 Tax=Futiania mangrovi TaxID=2959716 RepID=A0A9J6PA39_9PROT|nr:DMT family transporter [Futiania mangrovii]MCP1336900.1 DMT family transporter [Futiania mangrovii]
MMLSGVSGTLMLSAIKHLAEDLHPLQIAFFRCVVGFIVLAPMLWQIGGVRAMRTRHIGLHALRGLLNAGAMLCFFWAVSITPLAMISAINFTAPLFATLLAILILGERVGIRRWAGLVIGFAGTLVIVRPGFEAVSPGAILALVSSLVWAGAMIVIKRLTHEESPLVITLYASIFVGLFALIPAIAVWQWPTGWQWGWLALIGVFGSAVQYFLTRAFSLADTTLVLPFDFLKLVWASIAGLFLFQEVPDIWTWIGGSVIFASSFYIAYRERRRGVPPRPRVPDTPAS